MKTTKMLFTVDGKTGDHNESGGDHDEVDGTSHAESTQKREIHYMKRPNNVINKENLEKYTDFEKNIITTFN